MAFSLGVDITECRRDCNFSEIIFHKYRKLLKVLKIRKIRFFKSDLGNLSEKFFWIFRCGDELEDYEVARIGAWEWKRLKSDLGAGQNLSALSRRVRRYRRLIGV
jgi:hypothetical protein